MLTQRRRQIGVHHGLVTKLQTPTVSIRSPTLRITRKRFCGVKTNFAAGEVTNTLYKADKRQAKRGKIVANMKPSSICPLYR
jgi:hypothetical protein